MVNTIFIWLYIFFYIRCYTPFFMFFSIKTCYILYITHYIPNDITFILFLSRYYITFVLLYTTFLCYITCCITV